MTVRRRGRVKASDIKNTRRWTKEGEWAEDDGVDTPLHGKAHFVMQRQSISVSYTYKGVCRRNFYQGSYGTLL